jgi:hypothetical protein
MVVKLLADCLIHQLADHEMMYVLWGLGIIVVLAILGFAALYINLLLASRQQRKNVRWKLAPIIAVLMAGKAVDPAAIAELAADAEFRNDLFEEMDRFGQAALFPAQYRTLEAFAESVIVSWLAHPNELRKAPDAIEMLGKHFVESETAEGRFAYFLYRFRVEPPHFAADKGWIAGVCGPFLDAPDAPLIAPLGLFSDMQPFDQVDVVEYIRLFHAAAQRNGSLAALQKTQAGQNRGPPPA